MIVYQLPNGKVVYLSLEQLLSLSDDDVSYLTEQNYGRSCSSPFVNIDEINEEEVVENDYLLSFEDDEDVSSSEPFSLDQVIDDL